MQYGFLTADHQCVTGVMAALKTHYGIGLIGEQIDNLALAFVTPLGTQHHDGFIHCHLTRVTNMKMQLMKRLACDQPISATTCQRPSR
jgi:hypothetical protein